MITGILSNDAPLRSVFKDGIIPLSKPGTVYAKLGDSKRPQFVYLVSTKLCTTDQIAGMANLMVQMGQGQIEEAVNFLMESPEVPIREKYVTSVSIPLRAFI